VEVVDPRSLVPMDYATILSSVKKTGRLVVADPSHRTCSPAAEIAATVAEDGFWSLQAPIVRVTTPDTHIPFSPPLEAQLYPGPDRIAEAMTLSLTVDHRGVDGAPAARFLAAVADRLQVPATLL
jgi:acetoin:2,6-dichlorophenolindophenol oxidoreductase subunit beta